MYAQQIAIAIKNTSQSSTNHNDNMQPSQDTRGNEAYFIEVSFICAEILDVCFGGVVCKSLFQNVQNVARLLNVV